MKQVPLFSRLLVAVFVLFLSSIASAEKISPAKNEWAVFQMAGFNLMWGKSPDTIGFEWAFIIKISNEDIHSIKIYDVTDKTNVLLVEDNAVEINDGKWVGQSVEEIIKKGSNHWVYNSADVRKRFRVVFTTSNGESKELIQSTFHPASERRMMLMTLG